MRAHNKNSTTDKEIWLLLWHVKQGEKVNPQNLNEIPINMINPIFKKEWLLHIIY